MDVKRLPTLEEVSARLRLENGVLIWKSGRLSGRRAGKRNRKGYLMVAFNGREIAGHRLVWLLVHGEWPTSMLDHRDGNGLNNSPDNLRQCTNSQNQANCAIKAGKFKGVRQQGMRFEARCAGRYLGMHSSAEGAARAYDAAAVALFGSFARTNFSEVRS